MTTLSKLNIPAKIKKTIAVEVEYKYCLISCITQLKLLQRNIKIC